MRYGIDAAYPFGREAGVAIAAAGFDFLGMYVGGPRALSGNAWHEDAAAVRYPVRDLRNLFGFLPIYVGRNVGDDPSNPWDGPRSFTAAQGYQDGEDADILTGACGFDRSTPLVLDIEYNTYEAHPAETREYVAGWVQAVNEAGHKAGIYADRATVTALNNPALVDFVWCAYWKTRATGLKVAPVGDFDPSWPPAWDVWQFGSSIISGVPVDLNSATDGFTFATYGR